MSTTKRCTRCHSSLPTSAFNRNPRRKDGFTSWCKSCCAEYQREYRTRPHAVASKRRYASSSHARRLHRRRAFRYRHGIEVPHGFVEELTASQGGVCAICKQGQRSRRALALDHCHSSGKLRGLLCDRCNLTLGKMDDDPSLLRAAADYVERYR